ncbi:calcium ATPase [Aspergillus homomorphus CBS 101889]|uniref:Calcium ATPase n=1 Tax=Aspergillus homomorphus (strain CBS 101889) TaxID=1450537 RepID=A0A395HZL9_ASPHC|nr:calcium ATPase [Aspergillus homomorphus CBS 101889]RAL12935.1 calcium ATPase [Aspergillus homomorphus CBS 101889]
MSLTSQSFVQDDLPEALAPDPQNKKDFKVADNCFAFSPGQLNKLYNSKSLPALYTIGELHGLEYSLRTNLDAGLSAGESILPGAVILEKTRQAALFKLLSCYYWQNIKLPKVDCQVRVVHSGRLRMVHINDMVVGDVVYIGPGDCAPADGVVIVNHGLEYDESIATSELDQIEKVTGEKATANKNPFTISGSKVLEGLGTYLVTNVGLYSMYGRIIVSLGTESAPTPL